MTINGPREHPGGRAVSGWRAGTKARLEGLRGKPWPALVLLALGMVMTLLAGSLASTMIPVSTGAPFLGLGPQFLLRTGIELGAMAYGIPALAGVLVLALAMARAWDGRVAVWPFAVATAVLVPPALLSWWFVWGPAGPIVAILDGLGRVDLLSLTGQPGGSPVALGPRDLAPVLPWVGLGCVLAGWVLLQPAGYRRVWGVRFAAAAGAVLLLAGIPAGVYGLGFAIAQGPPSTGEGVWWWTAVIALGAWLACGVPLVARGAVRCLRGQGPWVVLVPGAMLLVGMLLAWTVYGASRIPWEWDLALDLRRWQGYLLPPFPAAWMGLGFLTQVGALAAVALAGVGVAARSGHARPWPPAGTLARWSGFAGVVLTVGFAAVLSLRAMEAAAGTSALVPVERVTGPRGNIGFLAPLQEGGYLAYLPDGGVLMSPGWHLLDGDFRMVAPVQLPVPGRAGPGAGSAADLVVATDPGPDDVADWDLAWGQLFRLSWPPAGPAEPLGPKFARTRIARLSSAEATGDAWIVLTGPHFANDGFRLITRQGEARSPAQALPRSRGWSLSPDGGSLAVLVDDAAGLRFPLRLALYDTDGRLLRDFDPVVSYGLGNRPRMLWEPRGRRLLVNGGPQGVPGIQEVDVQTGTWRALTAIQAEPLAWSLDGSQVYASDGSGVVVLQLDRSGVR